MKPYIQDLTKANSQIQTVVTGFDNDYSIIDSKDGKLYIETNLKAPNKKLIAFFITSSLFNC